MVICFFNNHTSCFMRIEKIDNLNRRLIDEFILKHWYTTKMIVRGKEIDMTDTEGFYVVECDEIVALITYIIYEDSMEIMSLDSLNENNGIGTLLLEQVVEEAKKSGCKKIVLITTNDNINAIRFYQKRGFDMANLFRNAMEVSRRMKPEIPLIGDNSIPLRHEIEFEMVLK